jgi:hypothetical protein
MKKIATVLASAALVLASSAASHASDQARFRSLVRKYIPDMNTQLTSFAPKTLCICEPTGAKEAGVMLSSGGFIGCVVPSFVNGALSSFHGCASYVMIAR